MAFLKKVEAADKKDDAPKSGDGKKKQTYVIKSVPSQDLGNGKHTMGIGAPGLVKWLIALYRTKPRDAIGVISYKGSGLPRKAAKALLSGEVEFRVDKGHVYWEY